VIDDPHRSAQPLPVSIVDHGVRAALYHPWVYLTSGIERTFVELLRRSRHDWTIYTHHHSPDTTYPELADARIELLSPPVTVRRSLLPLLQATRAISNARLPADAGDALLVSSEGLGDFILNRATMPAVCFCHTPLKILHDPQTRAALRASSPLKYAASRALAPAFAGADRRMWRRYRHVFANSRETQRRIATAGLADPDRIEVLTPGVDVDRFAGVASLRRRPQLFLVAGRIMWQKNIELAIDAIAEARADGVDVELVVAGAVDEKSKPYLQALQARAAGLPVIFEANPTDERLTHLYLSATALVFTPRNEDWGIVPLEAMAAGAPVISVDNGGPRESIVDQVTGWLLPPDPVRFAEQIARVSAATERDLGVIRRAAREHAQAFGWESFVARVDDVMERVAESRAVAPPAAPPRTRRTATSPRRPGATAER
jgi:glycosyltransferase involved in cell wall biosynthesis